MWAMAGVAVAMVAGLLVWHETSEQIIAVEAAAGVLGILVHEVIYFGRDESVLLGVRRLLAGLRGSPAPPRG
jgi:hypothetical protein